MAWSSVGHKSLTPFAQWQHLWVLFLTGIYIPMYDKNCASKEVEKRGGGCEEFVYRSPCRCSTPMWELISSQPQLYNSWKQEFFYLLLKHAPLWANQPTAEQLFASLLHLVAANLCTRTQNPTSHSFSNGFLSRSSSSSSSSMTHFQTWKK